MEPPPSVICFFLWIKFRFFKGSFPKYFKIKVLACNSWLFVYYDGIWNLDLITVVWIENWPSKIHMFQQFMRGNCVTCIEDDVIWSRCLWIDEQKKDIISQNRFLLLPDHPWKQLDNWISLSWECKSLANNCKAPDVTVL